MSYNGSGTFLINTAGQPVVSGTVISSTAFNALTADLATGLSTAITKDGQTTVTANIPMSTYKFTGLGVGSAATDSANLSQVQSTVTKLLNSVSGADTITATASPTLAAYAAGQMFYFVAAGDNTTSVTLNIDSLGAKAVTRDGATALAASDIKSGEVVVVVYDGTRFQVVSQLNSAGDARFANVSIASSLYVGGVSTFVGNAGFSANVSITSALSVGGVAAITGATTIGGNLTLSGGTANGVLYLNGSKVATSGSALTFDGTALLTKSSTGGKFTFDSTTTGTENTITSVLNNGNAYSNINYVGLDHIFKYGSTELARFTSSGNLGIGTTSPAAKLDVDGQVVSRGSIGAFVVEPRDGSGASWTIYNPTGDDFRIYGNGSDRLTIDNSGNLGIGTSSPAARLDASQSNPTRGIVQRVFNSATSSQTGAQIQFAQNSVADWVIGQPAGVDAFAFWSGRTPSADGTERARITSGGLFQVIATGSNSTFTSGGQIALKESGNSPYISWHQSTGARIGYLQMASGGNCNLWVEANQPLTFATNNTERARIGSNGDIYLNGSTVLNGFGNENVTEVYYSGSSSNAYFAINNAGSNSLAYLSISSSASGTGATTFFNFAKTGTTVGTITTDGTNTAYNTSSDRRLKDNIAPANDAGSVIDAMEVVKHDWKSGGHTRYGMIAQDLYKVAPEAVYIGDEDGVEELKTGVGVVVRQLVAAHARGV